MKKRYAALAIALSSLLAFAVFAASQDGPAQEAGRAYVVPAPVAEQQATPAATAPDTGPVAQEQAPALADDPAQAKQRPASEPQPPPVRTGCGKAVPCPNRDCKDCPHNIYLK